MEELENAIKAINTGKSEDIYGLSIENIIYAGEDFQLYMLDSINNIISQYSISELIKAGLLSPIYKNLCVLVKFINYFPSRWLYA
jgi:hypothetical protein